MMVFIISIVAGFFFWPIWIFSIMIAYEALSGTSSSGASKSKPKPVISKKSSAQIITEKPNLQKVAKPSVASVPAASLLPRQADTQPNILVNTNKQPSTGLTQVAWSKIEVGTLELGSNTIKEYFSRDESSLPLPVRGWPDHKEEYSRIKADVQLRGITALYHFTKCKNLQSILSEGIQSVESMKIHGINANQNDEQRLDGKLNGISISVSFPNYRMFYKYRMNNAGEDWVVIKIKAEALHSLKCGYFEKNAADHRMRYLKVEDYNNYDAFARMFQDDGNEARLGLAQYHPTDVQAEVMIFEKIPSHYIEALYFETEDVLSRWKSIVGDRTTVVEGKGRGLFGARKPSAYH